MSHAGDSPNPDPSEVSEVYRLLARIWLAEVDERLVARLADKQVAQSFTLLGGVPPTLHELDDLAVEFCRLFIGPRDHLPPLQSVWERGELQSEITSSVRLFAEAVHYAPPRSAQPMFDHLGLQLDIMARMETLVEEPAGAPQAIAREFFRRHLTWPHPLLQQVQARAALPFYASVARLTAEFLELERARWDAEAAPVDTEWDQVHS